MRINCFKSLQRVLILAHVHRVQNGVLGFIVCFMQSDLNTIFGVTFIISKLLRLHFYLERSHNLTTYCTELWVQEETY